MGNNNKWVSNFMSLDDIKQYEAAKAIMEELGLNEKDAEKDYDVERSKEVRDFFYKMIPVIKDKAVLEQYSSAFNRFDSLSDKNKQAFLDEMYSVMNKYIGIQEQEDAEEYCKCNGHSFGGWHYYTRFKKLDEWHDGRFYEGYTTRFFGWERACTKCGFVEESNTRPNSIIAKQRKITNKTINENKYPKYGAVR